MKPKSELREIDWKINNGCWHQWVSIWWKPTHWRQRVWAQAVDERKFTDAGYVKAYRCSLECGLAYRKKDGSMIAAPKEDA